MEKLSFKCQIVYAVENFLRPPQKISAVWLFAFFETPRELCVFFWIETHVQFGGYDNRALVVGGSSPFGNPPTVLPPARQDGDRHHRHRHRHHHHLTSSSDQLDRLENSLALEMVLVKRIWWKELGRKRGFVLGMFYLFKRFASHRFSFHWQLWPKFTRKECWNWKWKPSFRIPKKTDQQIFCYHHKMKCIVKKIIMIVFLFMMMMLMTVCLLMMMTMIVCLFMKVDCQCGSSLLRVDPVVGRRL